MAQYLDKAGLTTLWTRIKTTFALKSHTHKKSEITDLTIPTVNNPTITINQGGVKKGSFSLNQSGAATIDLTDDNTTYSVATQSADGLMSAADKKKLEGIADGANKITVDESLSSTSTNPVQNKVINSALNNKQAKGNYVTTDTAQTITATKTFEDMRAEGNITVNNTNNNSHTNYQDKKILYTEYNSDGDIEYDYAYTLPDKSGTLATTDDLPKTGYSTNGKNYKVSADSSGNLYVYVPWTDTNTTYSTATQSANGLMSSTDKKKLDGIAEGANKITVDSSLSSTSTNPVQNKVIKSALDGKAGSSHSHSSLTNSSGRIFNVPTGGSGGEQKTLVITDDLNAYQPAGNYANASHDHTISDITGLYDELTGMTYVTDSSDNSVQLETYGDGNSFSIPTKGYVDSALDGKSNTGHGHTISNITNLQSTIESIYSDMGLQDEAIAGKADSVHTHEISNINGLQSALNGKASSSHNHDNAYQPKGNYVTTDTAQTISGLKTFKGNESNNISFVYNGNSTISGYGRYTAIRHAISFPWYNNIYQIGNIRGDSDDSLGFGITKSNNTIVARFVDTSNAYIGNNTIIHSGNIGSQSVSYANSAGYLSNVASINGSNTAKYPWRRMMSIPATTANYYDTVGTYYLCGNYHSAPYYLFRVEFRTNTSSAGDPGGFAISVIATNSDPNNLAIASYSVATNGVTTNYSDIFVKTDYGWPRMTLTRLSPPDNGSISYYNSDEGYEASSRIAAYIGINGSGTGYASYELHSLSAYTNVTYGTLTASVKYASNAGWAKANDVYDWAKASSKPSYTASEVGAATASHTHSSVTDIGNGATTTFAYSKAGLNYDNYTWLAAWNGLELRAVNKSQFAKASHTHTKSQITDFPTSLPASNISMSSDGTTLTITYS